MRVQMSLYPYGVGRLEDKQTCSWDVDVSDYPWIIVGVYLCASVLLCPSVFTLHLTSPFHFFCLSLLPYFSLLSHPVPLFPALLLILFFSFDIHA